MVDKIRVGSNPQGVCVSRPTGRFVYVACPGTNKNPSNLVYKISTKSKKIVAKIKVGKGCSELAMDHEGTVLYVANTLDNTISVIAPGLNRVAGTKPTGKHPTGIAFWY